MNYPAASHGASAILYDVVPGGCHPRMFLSGVQSESAWIPAKNMRE